mmetsp:Transcript_2803/g.3782  ORF Transcript_2803/g.3782 Transcript_2803/m.3782 type:complete len:705 (+) Transcript_2803:274-2388(+)
MSTMVSLQKWKKKQAALQKLKLQKLARTRAVDVDPIKKANTDSSNELPSILELNLEEIRNLIPKECFEISESQSIYFLAINLGCLITSAFTYSFFVCIPVVGLGLYWNVYGFVMWRLFAIGHDCVHRTFSNDDLENKMAGRLCLTPLCMPYSAFQYEHNRHHMYVGQYKKYEDHPYFTGKEFRALDEPMKIFFKVLAPLFGYSVYAFTLCTRSLLRIFSSSKRSNSNSIDIPLNDAQADMAFIAMFLVVLFTVGARSSPRVFFNMYVGCFLVFSLWIFMASYMQRFKTYAKSNRHPNGVTNGSRKEMESKDDERNSFINSKHHHRYRQPHLYDESAWKFETGALGVGEHEIGEGFDKLQHNVARYTTIHYLFPNEIPHYNLERAHRALRQKTTNFGNVQHHGLYNYMINFASSFYKFGYTKFQVNTGDKKTLKQGRVAGIPMRLLPRMLSEDEKIHAEYERIYGVPSVLVRRVISPQTLEKIEEALAEENSISDSEETSESDGKFIPKRRKHVPRDSLHADAVDEKKLAGLENSNNIYSLGLSRKEEELLEEDEVDMAGATLNHSDREIKKPRIRRARIQIMRDKRAELDKERRLKSLKNVHFVSVTRFEYTRPHRLYVSEQMNGMPWEKRARRKEGKLIDSVKHDKTLAALKALSPGYHGMQSRREKEREELRKQEEERMEMERKVNLKKYLQPLTSSDPYYL